MSSYENYNSTSKHYDKGRVAVGKKLIQRILRETCAKLNIHISCLRILDAGCGTGNYIDFLWSIGCRNIVGLEINDGMLKQCKEKCIKKGMKSVELMQGNIIRLPLIDSSFDVVFANQVLHHIGTSVTRKNDYSNIKLAIKEMNRVLTNDGVLMIDETAFEQVQCYWFYDIMSKEYDLDKLKLIMPKLEWWKKVLNNNGFNFNCYDLSDSLVEPLSMLNNPKNAHDPEWRALISGWALLNENELKKVLDRVDQACKNEEKWSKFMKEKERNRMIYGMSTYYVAYKIASVQEMSVKTKL